jgi:chromosome segregation ATPase
MDSEFINVYIANQKKWIEDLTAKMIILEARIQIAEQKLGQRNAEVESLQAALEEKNQFINRLVETLDSKDQLINNLKAIPAPKKKKKQDEEIDSSLPVEVIEQAQQYAADEF